MRIHWFIVACVVLSLVLSASALAQYTVVWEKSKAGNNMPSWFSTGNYERGLAFGKSGGQSHLYVVSRNGGSFVHVLNAATGDSLGKLNTTGVSGGTLPINDVEVSADSVIFACNLSANATDTLRVYKWTNEAAAPVRVIAYPAGTTRYGDKFTVVGSTVDNSIAIYFASANSNKVLTFTTTDNGATFTGTETAITGLTSLGATPSVAPIPSGGFYLNGNAINPTKYDASWNAIDTVSGGIIPKSTNAIRYVEKSGRKYVVTYDYIAATAHGGFARIADVTAGSASATTYAIVPAGELGTNANGNGTGDVAIMDNGDGSFDIAVLGSNNGLGVYRTDFRGLARVTFWLNTSTVVDTIRPNSVVQVRGNTYPLTWDGGSVKLANAIGDYWSKTVTFRVGDALEYKYFVGDWESGGNKTITLTGDTSLPVAYYNNGFNPPYTPTDSIDMWFRVNMGSRADFDPAMPVGVRGDFPQSSGWSATIPLSREGTSKFYSGVIRVSSASAGTSYGYKFVFGTGPTWEDAIGNRSVTANVDTTLYWKTFEDKPILVIQPDTVTVHFMVNAATVPDTLRPISFVQVRGSLAPLTWGMTSPVKLTNTIGDYWTGTANFVVTPGTTIQYKFYTNHLATITSNEEHQGWENNTTDASGNRLLTFNSIPAGKDTVLPLQYVNGSPTNQPQYWKPYTPNDTSVAIMFRVNMQSNEGFNKANQILGVRGSLAPLDWGKTFFLKQETQHGNAGSRQYDGTNFWSGVIQVPKSTAAGTAYYKFVIHNAVDSTNVAAWEDGIPHGPVDVESGGGSNPARIFSFAPSMPDTTLYWKFWANRYLAGFTGQDTVIITFRANMKAAIAANGFTLGDTMEVRSGYGSSAKEVRSKRMLPQGLTTIYQVVDTVVTVLNTPLYYQYYKITGGADQREIYYNFSYSGSDVSLAERRSYVNTTKTVTLNDTSSSATNDRRMPRYRNQRKIARDVAVTYTLDIRPAIYQVMKGDTLTDIQGTLSVTNKDSILKWGVAINGPATGSWATWGVGLMDTTHRLYDDGTHGDAVSGDSIFTRTISYLSGATTVGQEFKFGIGGGDNEGGRGGFGNNHIENIDDSAPTAVIASQWGSMNPLFYNAWDYTNGRPAVSTGVEGFTNIPLEYSLSQNYPNPFNPATRIDFALPKESNVTLKVFNLLGQVVTTLVDGKQIAGKHSVVFDAARFASGLYFYQIKAGDYVSTKKMMLLK